MKTLENYLKSSSEAFNLVAQYLDDQKRSKIQEELTNLEQQLKKDSFIKVPFVGDFNAGKSSLINAYLDRDLLVTNMLPETAFAYELYYSDKEYFEVVHEEKVIESDQIGKLPTVKAVPGDVVKVYINNEKIQQLNEKGIVIVDMPGIDSGIEAHNNAILHYIEEGTAFVIFIDAEQATLRSSTISFINEIKNYNLSASVIISKADKKPEEEILKIKEFIEDQVHKLMGENVYVGVSSAADKKISEIENILNSIDADDLVSKKDKLYVVSFINELIEEIQIKVRLTAANKKDFDSIIQQLRDKQQEAVNSLNQKNEESQSASSSADDIIEDIKEGMIARSTTLANLLYQNPNDNTSFNAELVSIIRPILINSFKREISEYQDSLSSVVNEFSTKVNDILQESNNKLLNGTVNILGNLLGAEGLDVLLKKGLDLLLKKCARYKGIAMLVKQLGKIAGPIVVILANIIPDILRLIFGKSKEKKIEELKGVIRSQLIDKLTETLRPDIEEMISSQQKTIFEDLKKMIDDEVAKIEDNINIIKQEKQVSEEEIAKKISTYTNVLESLNAIVTKIN